MKIFTKTAIERRRFAISYDCFLLETEDLDAFQVVIGGQTPDAPLIINHAFPDVAERRMMMYISGGKANTNYLLQFLAGTSEMQVKRDDVGVRVLP